MISNIFNLKGCWSMPIHHRVAVLFAAVTIYTALATFVIPARSAAAVGITIPQDCLNGRITLHKDSNFNGEMIWFSPGLNWYTMASGWNDVVSSVCVPPGAYVTLFQNSNYWGGSVTIDARNSSEPVFWNSMSWYWNDATSSFKSGR